MMTPMSLRLGSSPFPKIFMLTSSEKRKRSLLDEMDNHGDAVRKVLDETPSAEDQLIIEQNLANLLQDIKKLKPHYQKVINLRYFNELSYAEIAKQLNEPVNNIKVKLLRAKKTFGRDYQEKVVKNLFATKMVKHLILFLFYLITIFSYSQSKIGLINDADGFANIRVDKTAKSEILGKILENEYFKLF